MGKVGPALACLAAALTHAVGDNVREPCDDVLDEAWGLLQKRRFEAARTMLKGAEGCETLRYSQLLAEALANTDTDGRDLKRATELLRMVVEEDPENHRARLTLANILSSVGDGFSMFHPQEFEAVKIAYEGHRQRLKKSGRDDFSKGSLPKPAVPWLDEEQYAEFMEHLEAKHIDIAVKRKERERHFLEQQRRKYAAEGKELPEIFKHALEGDGGKRLEDLPREVQKAAAELRKAGLSNQLSEAMKQKPPEMKPAGVQTTTSQPLIHDEL